MKVILNQMSDTLQELENALLGAQVQQIGEAKKNGKEINKHSFNRYADKQLNHLVISQEFNFKKIASLLNQVFRNDGVRFTELGCRERWAELHQFKNTMSNIRDERTQNKRITSVAAMQNPYSLYDLNEMLQQMQQRQISFEQSKLKENHNSNVQDNKQDNELLKKYKQTEENKKNMSHLQSNSGYNIFKHSFRQIQNKEQYLKREQIMRQALRNAMEGTPFDEKPLLYKPNYSNGNNFDVQAQELTVQTMSAVFQKTLQFERVSQNLEPVQIINKNFKSQFQQKRQYYMDDGVYDEQECN